MQTHPLKEKASMNELSNNLNLKLEGQRLYEIHMIAFLNTNLLKQAISHEGGKDLEVFMTSGTYP
jgi:hypothetical protein